MEAGYYIFPNLPGAHLFGVKKVKNKAKAAGRLFAWEGHVPDTPSDGSPAGKGVYLDPLPRTQLVRSVRDDKEVTCHKVVEELDEADFPLKLVKPRVLSDVSRAMTLRIFDELGCFPTPAAYRRGADPLVVGRVVNRIDQYSSMVMTFLVVWWMDLERGFQTQW